MYHLPDSRQKRTFYEDDPELRHSQSFAGFEVHLKRKPNKYLQNYFVPSGLLVVISWVSLYEWKLFDNVFGILVFLKGQNIVIFQSVD